MGLHGSGSKRTRRPRGGHTRLCALLLCVLAVCHGQHERSRQIEGWEHEVTGQQSQRAAQQRQPGYQGILVAAVISGGGRRSVCGCGCAVRRGLCFRVVSTGGLLCGSVLLRNGDWRGRGDLLNLSQKSKERSLVSRCPLCHPPLSYFVRTVCVLLPRARLHSLRLSRARTKHNSAVMATPIHCTCLQKRSTKNNRDIGPEHSEKEKREMGGDTCFTSTHTHPRARARVRTWVTCRVW